MVFPLIPILVAHRLIFRVQIARPKFVSFLLKRKFNLDMTFNVFQTVRTPDSAALRFHTFLCGSSCNQVPKIFSSDVPGV